MESFKNKIHKKEINNHLFTKVIVLVHYPLDDHLDNFNMIHYLHYNFQAMAIASYSMCVSLTCFWSKANILICKPASMSIDNMYYTYVCEFQTQQYEHKVS